MTIQTDTPAPDDVAELDPSAFDLDSWISGVQRLRQTVTIYGRGDLMPRIDELVDELEQLKDRDVDEGAGEVSLAEVPRSVQLREDLRAVWAEYEASGVDFVLEQCTGVDLDETTEEAQEAFPRPSAEEREQMDEADLERRNADSNELFAKLITIRSIRAYGPTGHEHPDRSKAITLEQFDRMRATFGSTQMSTLLAAAQSLAFTGSVTAPFSRRVSAILSANTSD